LVAGCAGSGKEDDPQLLFNGGRGRFAGWTGRQGFSAASCSARRRPPIPACILATGYSQEIAQSGSGGRPVILKPYRLATLSQALADAMNGQARHG
jgi:hypothetical protein